GQLPDAVTHQLVQVSGGGGDLVLVRNDVTARGVDAHPDAVELGDLLPHGHPGHQVADPAGPGGGRVTPHLSGDAGARGDVADGAAGAWFHQGEDSPIKRYRQRLTYRMLRAKLCGKPGWPH